MNEKSAKTVITEKLPLEMPDQYLGLITLNRPQEMNPLDWPTLKELDLAFKILSGEDAVRVIAITGAGRAFSAGGDLKAYLELYRDEQGFQSFLNDFRSLLDSIGLLKQPVVALVNGYCVAGGLELMLACDFAYAASSAKIGDCHANYGQVGGAGSNVRLPRSILPAKARELLFTGDMLNASEALQWGLINRIIPDGELLDLGMEFANVVASKSSLGTGIIKEVCNSSINMSLEDALDLETKKVHQYAVHSHDSFEGLKAFSEKRKPEFKGK